MACASVTARRGPAHADTMWRGTTVTSVPPTTGTLEWSGAVSPVDATLSTPLAPIATWYCIPCQPEINYFNNSPSGGATFVYSVATFPFCLHCEMV